MAKKILVVDDEFFITRSLAFMFKKEGYESEVAHNGQEALEKMRLDPPALIFLDLDMPIKNGYETAREIRQNPDWQQIPIIVLTAKGQDTDIQKALDAGANEYLPKPFDPKKIIDRVKEILG